MNIEPRINQKLYVELILHIAYESIVLIYDIQLYGLNIKTFYEQTSLHPALSYI